MEKNEVIISDQFRQIILNDEMEGFPTLIYKDSKREIQMPFKDTELKALYEVLNKRFS